jgi:hypothetical protein
MFVVQRVSDAHAKPGSRGGGSLGEKQPVPSVI